MVSGRIIAMLAGLLALGATTPAAAQFSDGFQFLKAVKDRDGTEAMKYLNKPGAPVLSAKDPSTGETAVHLTTRRHDAVWLNVMLSRGASPDAEDKEGLTALAIAAQTGDVECARLLIANRANPNARNRNGETPLILAVHNRDVVMTRLLLQNGADAKIADTVAGKTAHDYATEDRRGAAVLKVIEDEAKPVKPLKVMGPTR